MKQLKTLIRLQRREMDTLRQRLSQLETRRDNYIREIESLSDALSREVEAAATLADLRGFFGDYSGAIKKKQHQLAASVVRVEQQIQELNLTIQHQYAQMKKYEIAYERYLEQQAREAKRREQKQMDEIGLRNVLFGVQE